MKGTKLRRSPIGTHTMRAQPRFELTEGNASAQSEAQVVAK